MGLIWSVPASMGLSNKALQMEPRDFQLGMFFTSGLNPVSLQSWTGAHMKLGKVSHKALTS